MQKQQKTAGESTCMNNERALAWPPNSADVMRRKLDAFIARVIETRKEIGYSTDVYTDSEFAPGVLVCMVMCGSDRDALELHSMIDQLISRFFQRYAA
jgi:hypothetical protein